MKLSDAVQLLDAADKEPIRLQRHLLVAAALGLIFADRPVVVGGTAEDYWAGDDYIPTDLDVCMPLGPAEEQLLLDAGFERDGRHWIRGREHPVAVEVPEARIDGDEDRTVSAPVGGAKARVISAEDLYLDRIRQATATPKVRSIALTGALAIAAARYDEMDWKYVREVIRGTERREPMLGLLMKSISRKVLTTVRREISRPVH